jgi:hypothetical protein
VSNSNQPWTRERLIAAVAGFVDRVADLRPDACVYRHVGELRDRRSAAYKGWGDMPGIYFFEQDSLVVYIGRALRGTLLRGRVHSQCTSFGDPAWDEVIGDDQTVVGAVPFQLADWYWPAALEAHLIGVERPPFNKRDS